MNELPDFEDALETLMDTYRAKDVDVPLDEIISVLELKLMALREEAAQASDEDKDEATA